MVIIINIFVTSMCLDQVKGLAYSALNIRTNNIDIMSTRVTQQNSKSDLSRFL